MNKLLIIEILHEQRNRHSYSLTHNAKIGNIAETEYQHGFLDGLDYVIRLLSEEEINEHEETKKQTEKQTEKEAID